VAVNGTNGVKPSESTSKVRLAETPVEAPKRERAAFQLGTRTYPVWTPAMVEARDKLRREGKKWYLLYDKLYDPRNLHEAWKQVEANCGAAGLSGETVERYREGLEFRLQRLARRLKQEQYEVRPIRRKLIPKGDGSGKMRPLAIPEVEDRIVQAAIVRLIEPIFEAKFLPCSHGFRPGRSAHHALAQLDAATAGGKTFLVDADIQDCFGSIPREPMMEVLAREIADAKLLRLVRRFLEADIVEGMRRWTPGSGTPQGAVLSPLLANIYMHEFDRQMTDAGCQVVRYADDFVIPCSTMKEAQAARELADQVLQQMGLTMHPTKTRVVSVSKERYQFLGYEFWPKGRQPRKSSTKKIRDAIRKKTPRKSGRSLRKTISALNPTLRGWYGYFRHSFWNVFTDLDGFVRRRLRSILRKFAKRKGTARPEDNARYPNAYFEKLGLFSTYDRHQSEAGARKMIAFPASA
jgi:RNA-directed DNA polymerase